LQQSCALEKHETLLYSFRYVPGAGLREIRYEKYVRDGLLTLACQQERSDLLTILAGNVTSHISQKSQASFHRWGDSELSIDPPPVEARTPLKMMAEEFEYRSES
jgi:hypothetical protein